ncbi:Ig-like domain-containing protein [Persicitalea jodogahamensis]|uniref:BIG2 domain-containing protein n=1 Tax=Persicitalea jodogahamensis TaxID=402147 RepID=A0A8J3D3L7_9BACT|nr:Ig-like domain-containing protein [Persicitalea jodogahamensis]GHB65537.1 hypothetical protein GCM10007390_19560 [Persicitalea jodogahamensis]
MQKLLFVFVFSLALVSCKKDEVDPVVIDVTELELHYDDDYRFELTQNGERISSSDFTWKSSNEKVGTIDADGIFFAERIGETTITATDGTSTLSSLVTIVPYSTLAKEPVLDWGTNRANVESKEPRERQSSANTVKDGVVTQEVSYKSANEKLREVVYVFEDDKLTTAALLLANTQDVAAESIIFLEERYSFVKNEDNIFIYSDPEKATVGLQVHETIGLIVIYLPYKSGGRLSTESDDFKSLFLAEVRRLEQR